MKALIISADEFEDTELLVPYYRLKEEGLEVDIASIKRGKIKGKHGYEVEASKSVDEIEPDDYGILILPGGKAPERLRKETRVLEIVRHFFEKNKPVSAICHGPLVLASSGVISGREVTGYRTTKEELIKADAVYKDKEVVIDGNLVTSRQPSDLPAFLKETLRHLRAYEKIVHNSANK